MSAYMGRCYQPNQEAAYSSFSSGSVAVVTVTAELEQLAKVIANELTARIGHWLQRRILRSERQDGASRLASTSNSGCPLP